jgi:heme/copper-type cytochrome/quinol oxidase subunit 4
MEHAPQKPTSYYVRVYATLVASVAAIFIIGTFLVHGNFFIVIGLALCLATYKAAYFMHLNTEKKWIWIYLITALVCLFGFFFGSARDILMQDGRSWTRCNAINDMNRERIATQIEEAGAHHPHLAGTQAPAGVDCVPQRF